MKKLEWASPLLLPDPWRLPFANYGLNRAFQGGLESGKIHCFTGPTGSGKSTQALKSIAAAQKMDKVCAYVDAEKSWSNGLATQCGIDLDKVKLIRDGANVAENVAERVCSDLESGLVDVLVIDSLSMIHLSSFYDDLTANPMGISARSAGFLLQKLVASLQGDQQVIIISHVSNQKMGMHFVLQAKSSNSQQHIVSNTVMFKLRNGRDNIRDDGYQKVSWHIDKSKQAVIQRDGEYYFKGQLSDFDYVGELITVAQELDIVQGSTWPKFGEEKWHGKAALIDQARYDVTLRNNIEQAIYEYDKQFSKARVADYQIEDEDES